MSPAFPKDLKMLSFGGESDSGDAIGDAGGDAIGGVKLTRAGPVTTLTAGMTTGPKTPCAKKHSLSTEYDVLHFTNTS